MRFLADPVSGAVGSILGSGVNVVFDAAGRWVADVGTLEQASANGRDRHAVAGDHGRRPRRRITTTSPTTHRLVLVGALRRVAPGRAIALSDHLPRSPSH